MYTISPNNFGNLINYQSTFVMYTNLNDVYYVSETMAATPIPNNLFQTPNKLFALNTGHIAVGNGDFSIKIATIAGTLIQTLTGHTGLVNCFVQLSNGNLASGSVDFSIRMWSPLSGVQLTVVSGHTGSVTALAVFADDTLVSGSADNSLKVWSPLTYALERTLTLHTSPILALLALSNDRLLSVSADNNLIIWDKANNWNTILITTLNVPFVSMYAWSSYFVIVSNDRVALYYLNTTFAYTYLINSISECVPFY
jgi:WD40 repeat protein